MFEDGEVQEEIVEFVEEREWKQFHTPKNLSTAISVEASELLENFVWKDPEIEDLTEEEYEAVKEELADILIYSIEFCHQLGVDPGEAVLEKIEKNREKYPVKKSKGRAAKYTEFD